MSSLFFSFNIVSNTSLTVNTSKRKKDNMSKFIIVNNDDGKKIRLNIDKIVYYYESKVLIDSGNKTYISLEGDKYLFTPNSVTEIDDLINKALDSNTVVSNDTNEYVPSLSSKIFSAYANMLKYEIDGKILEELKKKTQYHTLLMILIIRSFFILWEELILD